MKKDRFSVKGSVGISLFLLTFVLLISCGGGGGGSSAVDDTASAPNNGSDTDDTASAPNSGSDTAAALLTWGKVYPFYTDESFAPVLTTIKPNGNLIAILKDYPNRDLKVIEIDPYGTVSTITNTFLSGAPTPYSHLYMHFLNDGNVFMSYSEISSGKSHKYLLDKSFNIISHTSGDNIIMRSFVSDNDDETMYSFDKINRTATLARYDSNGNLIFDKTLDPSNMCSTYPVDYMPYTVMLTIDINDDILFSDQTCLSKYSSTGDPVWSLPVYDFFSVASETSIDLITPVSDGYVLGGSSHYNLPENRTDLVKINLDGQKVWEDNTGPSPYGRYYAIQELNDGSVIVAGQQKNDVFDRVLQWDAYVAKYDNQGNQEWKKILGTHEVIETYGPYGDRDSADYMEIVSGIHTANNMIYYSGLLSSVYQRDLFVIKADSNGNIIDQPIWGSNATNGGSDTGGGTGGDTGGGSYPTKPSLTPDGCYNSACQSDAQLQAYCQHADVYYDGYLNAIAQGYSETDANKTYKAHSDAASIAEYFLTNTTCAGGF